MGSATAPGHDTSTGICSHSHQTAEVMAVYRNIIIYYKQRFTLACVKQALFVKTHALTKYAEEHKVIGTGVNRNLSHSNCAADSES